MIAVPFTAVEKSIKYFGKEIDQYKSDLKARLLKLSNDKRINKNNRRYIKALLKIANNIITAKPTTLNRYQKMFDRIVRPETMKSKSHKRFRDKLLIALGYNDRRGDFYPKYFQQVGIEACVYCNSMLTVSVEKIGGKKKKKSIKARFQVDHYLPKSQYPCFSISLYNLYPTCASCNNVKSTKAVQFKLYENGNKAKKSDFYFDLNMVSVSDYLLNRKSELILYEFQEPPTRSLNVKGFNEVFAIQGIYDTQKSIAEELILKAEIYTKAYKTALISKYPKILNSANITDRLIMGNYTAERDLHKRPMAKFMIDIAKQVGLI